MKNAEIIVCLNTFGKIKQEDRKLSIKLSYAINRNMKILTDAYKAYLDTFNEHGWDVDKLNALPPDEKKQLKELKNLDVKIDLFKLCLDDLLGSDLTVNEMEVIQTFMMKEGDD